MNNPSAGVFARLRGFCMLGARQALQWRLLLIWVLALLLPAVLAVLPLGLSLGGELDRSLAGPRLVEGFDPTVLADTIGVLRERGWAASSSLGGIALFVLLLPWLTGVVMTAARAPQAPGFGALIKGGIGEYPRMARLWLWALVPLLVAGAIGSAVTKAAGEAALKMTLESDARWAGRAALAFAALLFLLAQATVDAARAQLVIEPRRRSVVLAWWRGTRTLLKRPLNILMYLGLTLAGLLLAALFGLLRLQVAPVGAFSFVAAVLVSQLIVLALAWMRSARLFALVAAGRR